jgi:uncharacterized protein (TIRG00374 family)
MSETPYLKRNWKLLLNIATIVALVILAVGVHKQLFDTVTNLGKVKAWTLLLIIPIEWLNYHAQVKLYDGLFKIVDEKLSYKYLFKLSLELNFVNHVFPSGGVTGVSYFGLRLRGKGIRAGKATLVQLMKLVMVFSSFEILLLLGMLILSAAGKVNNFIILIGTALTTLLVVLTGLFIYIISSRERIHNFFRITTKGVNRLIHVVRPGHPETISFDKIRPLFDELHDNYGLFKSKFHELEGPFLYALITNITEIAVVYVVFVAFGHWVNVGAVILAYAVANFAGLVSVLPGGIGVYEALMTAVLVAGGIPAAVSIPAIVMYRVLNTILQLPPGFYYYHRTLQGRNEEQANES